MWVLAWTNYKASKFATFMSVIGALTRYGGIICLFSGVFLAALICVAIGIGIHFLAEEIAFKAWIKVIKKEGLEQLIRNGDIDAAVKLYNASPSNRTLKYFDSLNPHVSAHIRSLTANKN